MKGALPVALLLLTACAAHGRPERAATTPAIDDGIPLKALPRQALGAGECGVYLWKTGAGARLVLSAKGNPPTARIDLGGRITDLPRVSGSGEGIGGIQTLTTYSDGATRVTLELTVERRDGLTQGAAIPGGSMRLDLVDGGSFVLPVAGMLACR